MRKILVILSIISSLAASSASAFIGVDSSGGKKARFFSCDDGIADGGYRAEISNLSEGNLYIVVLEKTKSTTLKVFADTVVLQDSVGKFKTYANNSPDSLLEATLSTIDQAGQISAVISYTNKHSRVRIPETGSMRCTLL